MLKIWVSLLLCGLGSVAAIAQPGKPCGWIVWADGQSRLQAQAFGQKSPRTLRYFPVLSTWDIRDDGKAVAYSARPNIKFFSAQSIRNYFYEQPFRQSKARLIFGAYEPTRSRFARVGDEIGTIRYLTRGRVLVTGEEALDFFALYRPSTIGIYEPTTKICAPILNPKTLKPAIRQCFQLYPALSRDEKTLVYLGVDLVSPTKAIDTNFETHWRKFLNVYERPRQKARVLLQSVRKIEAVQISPNGRFCIFTQATTKQRTAPRQIMRADLTTGKITALTQPKNETDSQPTYSPDSRFVAWIRRDLRGRNPKLALMNSDGTQQRPIRFGFKATQFRWISSLPNWK